MIRFVVREFRTQAMVAFALLVVAAVVLAITGANIAHLYDTTVANCAAVGDCSTANSDFLSTDAQLQNIVNLVLIAVPAVLGMFWGAPLIAREFEAGTNRLAWTQSVTRGRWLGIKIGVVGIFALVVTGLLSLMVTLWFSHIDRVADNVFGSFDMRDIVPIGYAAFAFALGVAAGALLRRTLPAMAATLVGFVAVRLAIQQWARPNLAAPLHKTISDTVFGSLASGLHTSLTPGELSNALSGQPVNAWILSDETINGAGKVIGQNGVVQGQINFNQSVEGYSLTIQGAGTCPGVSATLPTNPGPIIQKCVAQLHLRDALTYQPGSRYWTFQGVELAIFLAAAFVLVGLTFWWIQRSAG